MFNEALIRAYGRTRVNDYFFKEELLSLNNKNISFEDKKRKEIIKKSWSNFKNQTEIKNKLKRHNLLDFVDYWESLGYFEPEEETKIDIEELMHLSKSWLKNFSAIIGLAVLLTEKNTELKNPLYIDENDFLRHQIQNSEYYSNKDVLSVDAIVKTSCFQQVTLLSTTEKKLTIDTHKELELYSLQIELKYLLNKYKFNIEKEKIELFSDIFYQLAVKSLSSSIEKVNNVIAMTEEECNVLINLSKSLKKTLQYLKEYDVLLKIIIMKELKR